MKTLLRLTIVLMLQLALASLAQAQQQESSQIAQSPLVRLLQSKGIITEQEAAMISQVASPAESEQRLAKLLLSKGVISQQEYDQTISVLGPASRPSEAVAPRVITAEVRVADPPVVKSSRPSGELAARGIDSTGGWAELHGEAPTDYQGSLKNFSANFGYGIENNRDEELIVGIRKRNQTFMLNGQYKFSPNFTFALEYRRVLTDWFRQPFADQKLNWASLAFLYSF